MNKSVKKFFAAGVLFTCLITAVTGCGASSKSADSAAINTASQVMNDFSYEKGMSDVIAEEAYVDSVAASGSSVNGSTGASSDTYAASGQKLIKTKTIYAETKDFDNVVGIINSKVAELSGYIENSSSYGTGTGYNMRSIDMTIRIPGESLELFVQTVGSSTTILSSSETTRDVTLDYVDMESHVKALRVEQDSLMSLLSKAESLDDIIRIQSQLTQVRYEIESYESRLRTMDNLVTYSTVNLTINEVDRETPVIEKKTFADEVIAGLKDNLYEIGQWLRNMAVWIIVSIPYILIWAVVICAAVVIVRKFIKKRKSKSEEVNEK